MVAVAHAASHFAVKKEHEDKADKKNLFFLFVTTMTQRLVNKKEIP